jgi:hypothetical protein
MINKKVPEWVSQVRELYANGASDIEVCRELKITQRKFDSLYDDPDNIGFRELVDYGRTMAKAFWYEQARKALRDKSFNSTVWMFVMKNRYGWAEKSESLERSDIPANQLSLEEMQQRLNKVLPGIIKQLNPEIKDSEMLGGSSVN